MSPGTSTELYTESVDRLRGGDQITPVEGLRRETFSLLSQIPTVRGKADVDAALPSLRTAIERPLAVALALLDHGGERGLLEVAWSAQTLATELGEAEPTEPMLALSLRDLSLSLLADCLGRGRLAPIPRLAAVSIPSRFERQTWPIFQAADLRHPNAFGRSADGAYTSWSDWLAGSELIAALTYVRDPETFKGAIAEAELLAALAFAQRGDERAFCAVIGTRRNAERRLRLRVRDPGSAGDLAAFLALPHGQDLGEALNELYKNLTGPDGFGAGGVLIVPD